MDREHVDQCKIIMKFKILGAHRSVLTSFMTNEEVRKKLGSTKFSVETNVAAATELSQEGDLDIYYKACCNECDSESIFKEEDPTKGTTLKKLVSVGLMCPYCGHEVIVDSSKFTMRDFFYRPSSRYVSTNVEKSLVLEDSEPELKLSFFQRLFRRHK